ncbi:unnamed protein product [Porites lobata]|uniref:Uncharacterized protein n=1 Tax=Porites lobata TaxID=104759 RepID=A0ABN8R0A9_9CNID|nr:unnamed protein product [Porites lobata]
MPHRETQKRSRRKYAYVHRESNHPPITTKNIPAGINRRLSSLSSDKASFDQATPPLPKSTRRKRIPLHSTLRTDYNC